MRLGRAGDQQQEVFDKAAQGAQEVDGLLLAIGAGAIAFGRVKELSKSGSRRAVWRRTSASWRLAR